MVKQTLSNFIILSFFMTSTVEFISNINPCYAYEQRGILQPSSRDSETNEPFPDVKWGINKIEADRRCPSMNMPIPKCNARLDAAIKTQCKDPSTMKVLPSSLLMEKKAKGYYPICIDGELWAWCPCGCFTPDTMVMIERDGLDRWVYVNQLYAKDQIYHLAAHATFLSWEKDYSPIRRTTEGTEDNPILRIITEKGEIKLTRAHGILLASGEMVQAQDLKVEQMMVDTSGNPVKILKIEELAYYDKVYNVETDASTNVEHIIFANGLAVGDLAWQNQLEDELYQIQLRK